MYRTLLAVGIGSFIGGIARYLTQLYFYQKLPSTFPFGTFIVNITGCFIIGMIYAASAKGNLLSPQWRIFLATGFCGGFTTFSTFAYENVSLLNSGAFFYSALYTGLSVVLGLFAAFLGAFIVQSI